MTTDAARPDDHPWYLDLRPDWAGEARDVDVCAALEALYAIGATVLDVHMDTVPTLGELVAGRCYIGWSILIPGSVERHTIEDIAARAGTGYRATITPGHPLPPVEDHMTPPATYRGLDHDAGLPPGWPHAPVVPMGTTASPLAGGA